MKILLLILFLAADTNKTNNTMVYVCHSAKAKRYHLRADCRGLSNCQHKMAKMKLSDAEKQGLTLCGYEK